MDVKRYCIVDKSRGFYLKNNQQREPVWASGSYILPTVSLSTEVMVWKSKAACKNFIKYQLMIPIKVVPSLFSNSFTVVKCEINYTPEIIEVFVPRKKLKKTRYENTDYFLLEKQIGLPVPDSVKKTGFCPTELAPIAYLTGASVFDYVVKVAARGKYEFNFPDDLLEDLCISAKNNNRTFSDEIIHRLVEQQANGKEG